MRFLLVPTSLSGPSHHEQPFDEAMFIAYMKFNEELHRGGVLVASEGLNPNAKAAHVIVKKGKKTVTDGPFAETKELVGGFWLIDVKSKEDAVAWALKAPVNPFADEVIEIRPLTGPEDLPKELVDLIRKSAPTWARDMFRPQPG